MLNRNRSWRRAVRATWIARRRRRLWWSEILAPGKLAKWGPCSCGLCDPHASPKDTAQYRELELSRCRGLG